MIFNEIVDAITGHSISEVRTELMVLKTNGAIIEGS